jgi:Icc-related predicted phosphoesterase
MERWTPAYWLRYLANRNVWTDGQRVELNGVSILNLGCTMRPKGGEADIWVVHAPPTKTLVSACADGSDRGDPDLVEPVRRYAPMLVLSGHVHSPLHWRERGETTLFLNPGCSPDAEFPNHILVNTDSMSCQFVAARRNPAAAEGIAARLPAIAEGVGVVTAAA